MTSMLPNKLARGMLEIPKGINTSHSDNHSFMSKLDRTNSFLVQFLSASDDGKMTLRTELEDAYFNLTVSNLKESIKHKVEQDMWNNLFKKHVSQLQAKLKSKDKLQMVKGQSELSLFLDEAIGFYSKFLDVLSLIYRLNLPGRRISIAEGTDTAIKNPEEEEEVSDQDLRYIVQHCFVHLGDLFRYHNLQKLARQNYEWAVQLDPDSGHAYNQLAILESSSLSSSPSLNYNVLLRTLLYYDRASTCQTPFPATSINLDSLLRHIDHDSVSELLTSNNEVEVHNSLSRLLLAWLHVYAAMRLRSNMVRCRQLQQRVVEWAGNLAKSKETACGGWRDLVTIAALHCALVSSRPQTGDSLQTSQWGQNASQFLTDLLDGICHGLNSMSHDDEQLTALLALPGVVSPLVVIFWWQLSSSAGLPAGASRPPFGEQTVRFVNVLSGRAAIDPLIAEERGGDKDEVCLPIDLPEISYLKGYAPIKVPCPRLPMRVVPPLAAAPAPSCPSSRASFLVRAARRLCQRAQSPPVAMDTSTGLLAAVPPRAPRRPVNVALASLKAAQAVPAAATDHQQIARYIQEHLGSLDRSPQTPLVAPAAPREDGGPSHGLAPAPGLILSSSLPPDCLQAAASTVAVSMATSHPPSQTHAYNPNREQFEKDLPPRFANKRKDGSGGQTAASLSSVSSSSTATGLGSYWDAGQPQDTSLTGKESEMLMALPPPPAWMTEDRLQGQPVHDRPQAPHQRPGFQNQLPLYPPSFTSQYQGQGQYMYPSQRQYPPIPPPPQSPGHQFDQYPPGARPSPYDKPVFSTSGGYGGRLAGQPQARPGNPLLHLLQPGGFFNEMQR